MTAWLPVAVALAALAGAAGGAAEESYRPGEVLFRFADSRIDESSGLIGPARAGGAFFTHNDSGDGARFFAVGAGGCTAAVYRLAGAEAVDWEDAAASPGSGGRMLWFGDTGDNARSRVGIDVYAVAEPDTPPPPAGCAPEAAPEITLASTRYRLRYPDGTHDAETLLADPAGGRLYLVTKERSGRSGVYAAPAALDPAGENRLERVAELTIPPSSTMPDPPPAGPDGLLLALAGRFLATGGAVAPDRSRVVVRTYLDAFEWYLGPGADLGATLRRAPDRRLPLPPTRQGEAISYAGRDLVTSCEDEGCPVHVLRRR